MSIKTKALCGFIFASGLFGAQKASANTDGLDQKKDSIEVVTKNLKENIPSDTTIALSDAVNNDSIVMAKKEVNFANAEKLMFYLVANFEGFTSQAYRLSYRQKGRKVTENFYTYNFGNTITAEGNKVKPSDRITTAEESFDCYNAFMKTATAQNPVPLKDAMMLTLPIDKMEDFEIAVMGEIGYNYGPGLFINKTTKQPKDFAKLASQYFNNRTPENWAAFSKSYLAHCTANGSVHPVLKERRQICNAILNGDIIIYVDDSTFAKLPVEKHKLAVNLKKNILGVLNGSHGNPETIQKRLESGYFQCQSGDSIKYAIEQDLNKPKYAKKQPRKKTQKKVNLASYMKRGSRSR